jgi:hypothetical protein
VIQVLQCKGNLFIARCDETSDDVKNLIDNGRITYLGWNAIPTNLVNLMDVFKAGTEDVDIPVPVGFGEAIALFFAIIVLYFGFISLTPATASPILPAVLATITVVLALLMLQSFILFLFLV